MLDSLKKKQVSGTMLKHFLLATLLFPIYTSGVGSAYSPDIIHANLFLAAFLVLACLEGNVDWKKKSGLGYVLTACLLGFNVCAFYVNKTYFGWYAGQINVTIAFLVLVACLFLKDSASCQSEETIKFLLNAVVITNAIGLIPYFMGGQGVAVSLSGYSLTSIEGFDDRYSWIYLHKSEYSFMLVLFMALAVTYWRLFPKKWMFWGSIGVFAVGLVIANTRTTMVAALFILVGVLVDHLLKKTGGFSWKYLLWFIPILAAAGGMLYIFGKDRDLLSLGYRTYIWEAAFRHVLDNPWGIGPMCGLQSFASENLNFDLWNCHNVFLNILLQYSIPAGGFYLLGYGAIAVAALRKNFSFTTLGILGALLVPMMMDWCILPSQLPMVLLTLYFIFFHPLRNA